jgi:membrane fusion protein (multidrug efflux system)
MNRTINPSPTARNLCLCLALAALAGCGRGGGAAGPGGMPGGMPGANAGPVEVGVVTIAAEDTKLTLDVPARINPVRVAQVRARVTGIVQKRLFDEGAEVRTNQVLFEIDPAPSQAAYDSAKAALARAGASREQAQAQAKRDEALVKINGVSQQAYETAKASALEAEADVLAAKAALETAALNLGYTEVTAPIAGRIGQALVTEGALVSASEATEMAVIRQLDPIYADATVSGAELLRLQQALEAGGRSDGLTNEFAISLVREDGTVFSHTGKLVFQDAAMDETTGSVMIRAEFPNPEKQLLPGMFVRARLEVTQPRTLTVPQRAVARDANGQTSVQLVNAKNQVEPRLIQTGSVWADKWTVRGGLQAGDTVIVEGLQKVRPGADVKTVPFAPAISTPKAGTAAGPTTR